MLLVVTKRKGRSGRTTTAVQPTGYHCTLLADSGEDFHWFLDELGNDFLCIVIDTPLEHDAVVHSSIRSAHLPIFRLLNIKTCDQDNSFRKNLFLNDQ